MRERRRREVFEKAEKEEEREKAIFARFVFCFWLFLALLQTCFSGQRETGDGGLAERTVQLGKMRTRRTMTMRRRTRRRRGRRRTSSGGRGGAPQTLR